MKKKKPTYQNLWDTAKAVQKGKIIVSTYIKNTKISNKQPNGSS
jgi:hypothetical protein